MIFPFLDRLRVRIRVPKPTRNASSHFARCQQKDAGVHLILATRVKSSLKYRYDPHGLVFDRFTGQRIELGVLERAGT